MSTIKIVIWNQEDYPNREAAERDGAVTEKVIPNELTAWQRREYIDAFVNGAVAASKRLKGEDVIQYEEVELSNFVVTVEVLEWNTYTYNITAEDSDEACFKALAENVSMSHTDVEYGTSGYEGKDVYVRNATIIK